MTTAIAELTLTADELAALAAALGVDRIPGLTELDDLEDTAEASAVAGGRSLCARGLASAAEDGAELGPLLTMIMGALAGSDRRLLVADSGLVGEVATVSVSRATIVVHQRAGVGIHNVALMERDGAEPVVAALLERYEGTATPEGTTPDPETVGSMAYLRVHSALPSETWMEEITVWVGEDGTVARIAPESGEIDAVTEVGSTLLRRLFSEETEAR